ncbi:MAG TPA: D-2-hydroxyacid dehydrogenase [Steroidobacteraceae bacterium]|nr:D-2-hydroxyacid dehydrogenase [Steroidobacteraceae bacterium]
MNHRSAAVMLAISLCASLAVSAAAPPAAPAVADTIARLRIEEAAQPVRERKDWRVPRKIVLLAFSRGTAEHREEFASAAPDTQIVLANNVQSAVAAVGDADVLIGFNPEICNPQIIGAAKSLRWILSLAAGVENCMALPIVHQRNLLMTNMRGVDSAVIAEDALALILALAHGLDVFAADTAASRWNPAHAASTEMVSLEGKKLLVVGLGGIGTELARRAHGIGMTVIATRGSGSGKDVPDFVSHAGPPAELLTLAHEADVIANCAPLTPQTRGMFDAKFFAVVKPTAFFINIARGGSVVTDELVKALNEHRLAGAGLDVVDPEPLPPDHPLWRAPRVLISPHISSRSDLPGEGRWILARENVRRYAAGEKMLSVVDLQRQY